MITHIIYHIPGRKVGCTKDLKNRKQRYLNREGIIPEIEILEELHDKTDQEAGDIEWEWAAVLLRDEHLRNVMNMHKWEV